MVFLTPLFLLGLLAALIPIAIHLIRKEKPPKLMFSSIRFLKKTSKKLILFQHIQQWLLLLLRSALIALLVFAIGAVFDRVLEAFFVAHCQALRFDLGGDIAGRSAITLERAFGVVDRLSADLDVD